MKILYVNHTGALGGGERSLLDLLDVLPEDVEPTVASPAGPLADALADRAIPVHRIRGTDGSLKLHPMHTPRAFYELASAADSVRRIARRTNAELIHANSIRGGMIANIARRLGGPRVIVHARDCLPATRPARAAIRFATLGSSATIANSSYTAQRLVAAGADGARINVIHNPMNLGPFDPERVDRDRARHELGLGDSSFALAVIGQLTPWKGQEDAIRALAKLRHLPEIRLLLVGSAKFVTSATRYDNRTYVESLRSLVEELGLGDRVTFVGEHDDIPSVLRALDLLLVPSWEEPFGRVVVEGMAMGLPVVATEIGGPAELIANGHDGVLLPPCAPERWASVIESLVSDSRARKRLGGAAQEGIRRTFARDLQVEAILQIYRAVLHEPSVSWRDARRATSARLKDESRLRLP